MSLFWKQTDHHITSLVPNRRVIISKRPYISLLGLQNMKTTCKKSWPVVCFVEHVVGSLYFLQQKLFLRFSQISMLLAIKLYLQAGVLACPGWLFLAFIISRRAFKPGREIIKCIKCVRAFVRACVSVMQISPKLLQLEIFCKLIVPMNFHALENFVGFVDIVLKVSE